MGTALAANPPLSAATEAEHLRSLLDNQPSCLMRVALDGLTLAANEAALRFFGTERGADILDQLVTDRIAPDHLESWRSFAARVWDTTSASVECDMLDLSGARRTAILHGIALRDHPDRVDSVLVAIRDTTMWRRIEAALEEAEANRERLEADRALLQHERQLFEAQTAALGNQRQRVEVGHEAAVEEERRQWSERLAHHEQEIAELHAALAGARSEQKRLAATRERDQTTEEAAASEHSATLKLLADQTIELEEIADQMRALEGLAAAGRLARDVARELDTVVADIGGRAKPLLSATSLDARYRPHVEAITRGALRAASLIRQLAVAEANRTSHRLANDSDADL